MPPSIPSPLISTRSISLLRRVRHPPTIRKTFSTVIDGPIPQPPESMTQQSLGLQEAIRANGPRSDWEKKEIETIYNTPLMKLAYAAVSILTQLEPGAMALPSRDTFSYNCHH